MACDIFHLYSVSDTVHGAVVAEKGNYHMSTFWYIPVCPAPGGWSTPVWAAGYAVSCPLARLPGAITHLQKGFDQHKIKSWKAMLFAQKSSSLPAILHSLFTGQSNLTGGLGTLTLVSSDNPLLLDQPTLYFLKM